MKRGIVVGLIFLSVVLVSCTPLESFEENKMVNINDYSVATFAGGCFWCVEAAFESLDGVSEAISGYSGGEEIDPTYKEVVSGKTGHKEAVQVYFDSSIVSYSELVEFFWRQIDPTDDGGQFADRGESYMAAIFYHDEEQKRIAEESKKTLEESSKFDKPIVTEIVPFTSFYKAEEYHQDYSKKKTAQYKLYEKGSGRADFKEKVWS